MKRLKGFKSVITAFLIYFFLCAFVITNSFLLFFRNITNIPDSEIGFAATVTFFNVLFMAVLLTVCDCLRRRYTVDKHVGEIQKVLNRLMKGDYSARVEVGKMRKSHNKFGDIAESINLLAAELSGVETLRTDFVSNVSHELKTPLAVMQNYATMLVSPSVDEEQRNEYANAISKACKRLAALITNILKLNKLENQKIFPDATEYDLSGQLVECLLQFESLWDSKGIEIETDIPDGVRINADYELMGLVWSNLFSNAFKFTPNGGKVSVRLSVSDNLALVSVSDTGCGIKPEVGKRIFDKFYQGDTSHATQGNGLGLALVKRVVDIMQGEVSVESVYGKGSTFSVKVPIE